MLGLSGLGIEGFACSQNHTAKQHTSCTGRCMNAAANSFTACPSPHFATAGYFGFSRNGRFLFVTQATRTGCNDALALHMERVETPTVYHSTASECFISMAFNRKVLHTETATALPKHTRSVHNWMRGRSTSGHQ